jgi:2-methylcitrate dehydratase
VKGEPGVPSALTAKTWGFQDALFRGKTLSLPRSFGSYVMENVLFKVAFPAEFHAQTAAECAVQLHPHVQDRVNQIQRIVITTQESALRIISKTGPLHNPADRDHCIQYIVAVGLIFGDLTADHYEDKVAADPRIDALRAKMEVVEDSRYSREYLEADKRSIANAVQVFFQDGSATTKVEIEYPLGHRRRRAEGLPLLVKKFRENAATLFEPAKVDALVGLCLAGDPLRGLPVSHFVDNWLP